MSSNQRTSVCLRTGKHVSVCDEPDLCANCNGSPQSQADLNTPLVKGISMKNFEYHANITSAQMAAYLVFGAISYKLDKKYNKPWLVRKDSKGKPVMSFETFVLIIAAGEALNQITENIR